VALVVAIVATTSATSSPLGSHVWLWVRGPRTRRHSRVLKD